MRLEAFISSGVFNVGVPREVKPARSRADARELLAMIEDMLLEDKLADAEPAPEPVPNEAYYVPHRHDDEGAMDGGAVRIDSTLEAFMAALAEQAAAGGERERKRRPRTKKKQGKRRR